LMRILVNSLYSAIFIELFFTLKNYIHDQ